MGGLDLLGSEIGIQSHSKLGTQMSRQISSKYTNPICGKLDNDVWAGCMGKAIYCCVGFAESYVLLCGVRRKLPPNPYSNISRPSQLRIQESHLGKAGK